MGLSRLDNFLKSARGTIIYVNPNDLDATDSIENQGNSLTRPFKIQLKTKIGNENNFYTKYSKFIPDFPVSIELV